jgi:hypothetical protein
MTMRGSLVVLAFAAAIFVAPSTQAQTPASPVTPGSQKCVQRPRANPSDTALANRVDPTMEGDKDCSPAVIGLTSVSGTVFFDVDGDGIFGPDEVGLSGFNVTINGPMSLSTTTDGNGAFSFTGLTPGSYTLCVNPPAGWAQHAPSSGPACGAGFGFTIVAPQLSVNTAYTGLNFGYVSTTGL